LGIAIAPNQNQQPAIALSSLYKKAIAPQLKSTTSDRPFIFPTQSDHPNKMQKCYA